MTHSSVQRRVRFDFEIEFSNGGGLQGQDFRLDIDGDDIDDAALADLVVRDLRLLMVARTRILNKAVFAEAHKRPAADAEGGWIDLSHVIEDGLVTCPGLPAARICDYLSRVQSRGRYAEGTEFQIARIDIVANTGTYLDCPFHRYPDGDDLAQLGPETFADLDALVVRADHREVRAIDDTWFRGRELRGRAVLVHTGWDAHWTRPEYAVDHPFLTEGAARHLLDQGARLVGIDAMNIDDTRGNTRPVHSILLGAGILIVEHLCNLGALPDEGFAFSAIPPKLRGVGTFPVRALARLHK